jgi:hypothetical protein
MDRMSAGVKPCTKAGIPVTAVPAVSRKCLREFDVFFIFIDDFDG